MILPIARPWRHPESGTYWFRRRVPKDLQFLLGRSEKKASLRTKDPDSARLRHLEKCLEGEKRWARLRAGAAALARMAGPTSTAVSSKEPGLQNRSFDPDLRTADVPTPAEPVGPARRVVPWRPICAAYAAEARLAPSTIKRWSGIMASLEERLGTDDLSEVT